MIQLPIFAVIIITIYQRRPFTCLLSFLTASLIQIILEGICLSILSIFHISLTEFMAASLLFRILITIPIRLTQTILLYMAFKIRKINLEMLKPSKNIWFSFLIFIFFFLSNLFLITYTVSHYHNYIVPLGAICSSILSFWVFNKLLIMNEQLQKHAATVEELAVAKERNRLAGEIHDILGNSLTLLTMLLNASLDTCKENPEQTEKNLTKALEITKEGLGEIRRSVSGMVGAGLEDGNIINALELLIDNFRVSGLQVNLVVEGEVKSLPPSSNHTIYRICQEALTNSRRHGQATQAYITLRFTENQVILQIANNGHGCGEIKKGFGLKGMEERVKTLDGKIDYGSDGSNGFMIRVEIPV
jgi:signal transduction histidine kinase